MNIMVAGAGVLGRELIALLLEQNHKVTAMALAAREFEHMAHPNLQTRVANVTQPETLRGICRGIDIVISCIGITRQKGRLTHMDVDYRGNLNLLREAEEAGAQKFAIVSPEGVDEGGDTVPLLKARKLFEASLRNSNINWLVFHSGGFFSDLAQMATMAQKSPLFVIGAGHNKFTPIAVHDLVEIVIADIMTLTNEVIHVGGPEDLSWRDICTICFQHSGLRPRIWSIPVWLSKFALWLIAPFSKRHMAMGRLLLFMSSNDLPTPQRGHTLFADFLQSHFRTNSLPIDRHRDP